MNFKTIFKTLGKILLVEAFLLLIPLIVALIYKENNNIWCFVIPMSINIVIGILLSLIKQEKEEIHAKEGFFIVGISWIILSIVGALPFVFSKTIPNFIDAFFESTSGFTTTGASVVTNIDDWNNGYKSLLFWRSFTHWIGGMGVLVLVLAITPKSEGNSIFLLKAESTGPQVGKLVSKIKQTARILYVIYLILTIVEVLLLLVDMPLFDALVHAFGTAGTGGFGIRGTSLGYYSIYSQVIVTIFMFLFGINFNLFYLILIGKGKSAFRSEELRWYFGIIVASIIIIMFNIYYDATLAYDNLAIALKDSSFQVVSIMTSTGYATTDFTLWPSLSKTILFFLMFIGACAGSTGGGIKVSRIVILFKSMISDIKKQIHPNSVSNVRFEKTPLDEKVVKNVNNYFVLFSIILATGIILISFNGLDFETNVTAMVSCLNNIGPGLSKLVGPMGSYASYNGFSKIILSCAMLIGRLEIYPFIMLFNIKMFKK